MGRVKAKRQAERERQESERSKRQQGRELEEKGGPSQVRTSLLSVRWGLEPLAGPFGH